jgi:hypothetical protein
LRAALWTFRFIRVNKEPVLHPSDLINRQAPGDADEKELILPGTAADGER